MPRPLLNPWLLAPALALASTAALWLQRRAVPERADWAAAVETIKADLQAGDGIAWAPYHAAEGRIFLHDLPAFHLPAVEAADLARYDRVWLLGAFGRDAGDLPPGHETLRSEAFGPLTLDLVKVGGERVVGDVYANLEQAQVARVADTTQRCDFWDGRGWHCDVRGGVAKATRCLGSPVSKRLRERRRDPHCGLNPWLNVSRDVRVVDRFPRRCVWFHPVAGKSLELRWPDAPPGEVVVDYGFIDTAVHDRTADVFTKPATLTVTRGEAALGERVAEPVQGWFRWRAGAGEGPLVISVRADSQRDMHLCIDPTVRGPR